MDEELAPTLRELWRRGYMTWASCQDWGDGTAQIVFAGAEMAHAFAVIAVGEPAPAGWRFAEVANPWCFDWPAVAVWFPRALLARRIKAVRR